MLKKTVLIIALTFGVLKADSLSEILTQYSSIHFEDENISEDERVTKLLNNKGEVIKNLVNRITENNLSVESIDPTERVNFLSQRIFINGSKDRELSVARDEVEILSINLKLTFNEFIRDLIKGRNIYLSESEMESLVDKFIDNITKLDFSKYEKLNSQYENRYEDNPLIRDMIDNIREYKELQQNYLEIASYIRMDIALLVQKSILLSIFKESYLVNLIDKTEMGKYINQYTDHYLSISIGKISVASIILLLIFSIRNFLIPFIVVVFEKIAQSKGERNIIFHQYLVNSLELPVKITLLIFGFQVSLSILDNSLINSFIDKLDTLYIIFIALVIYNLINNAIIFFSENIIEKYPNVRQEMVNFFVAIFKGILLIVITLLILKDLGYDVTTIVASLGVGGIAIALAAQSTLSNFFGSLTIILDNSFSQGDWIETPDVEGTVVELGLRSTTIRTFDNALVTVPNSTLANSSIKNWSRREIGRRIKLSIGVTYESKKEDILKAIDDMREYLNYNPKIADSTTKINRRSGSKLLKREDLVGVKNSIFVNLSDYNSSSIDIMIYCFTKTTDWKEYLTVKEEVLLEIWNIIDKNSLEFAYPTQKLFMERSK